METRNCLECGAAFTPPSQRGPGAVCCSPRCKDRRRRKLAAAWAKRARDARAARGECPTKHPGCQVTPWKHRKMCRACLAYSAAAQAKYKES